MLYCYIFGESAGGGSVISLLAADGSDGLFNRVISQSGAGLNHSKEKYDETNQAGELLKAVGVSDMDGLMPLSEAELYDAMCADTERIGYLPTKEAILHGGYSADITSAL